MIIILLNLLVSISIAAALTLTETAKWGWSILWGVLTFAALQALISYIMQRKVKAAMERVQSILMAGEQRLRQKVNQWQLRPPGSIKQVQLLMEREQRVFVERALEASQDLERFFPWVPLMKKQVATVRMQLYWMIKEFKQVDKLMPEIIMLEPMTAAIKISRMYMLGEEGIDKVFLKSTARLRYGQGALLYGLYSWILVQRQNYDEAHRILIGACDKLENETLKRNRDALANNKITQFSNAGFGEEWYALHLEQPKVKIQRQARFSNRPF